jgi:hypothetical protein
MNTSLIRFIGIVCICFASVSFASLPQVIGNFEDSNDGWVVNSDAPEGTTAHFVKENGTLGKGSLKVSVPSGWQKAVSRDLSEDANALAALGKATQLKVDVTLKAKEWSVGSGWMKAIECVVISSDMGGWQQIDPVAGEDAGWDGQADKTVTVTFDVPPQTPPDLTTGSIVIVTNYDGVEKAGPFYFDNVRLVGAGEPNQPKVVAKPAEPNKPAEAKKPVEPNKPAETKKAK